MFSILYPQIQYQPGSFVESTIDSRIPTSFSSTGGMIMEGALFVNLINDIKDSDIASREMGYTGGPLKGITTRQIPGGSRMYAKNAPGVVFLTTPLLDVFASGCLISADGDIITNWHVVEGNEKMLVWFYDKDITKLDDLGKNTTVADVIGIDKERDLALLKIQAGKYKLKPLTMGKKYELSVAQDVFAIGHPEGQIWTYTDGTISQIRDKHEWTYSDGSKHIANLIQTHTPINTGNSGGPLFDNKGKLIGINTNSIPGSQGLNFAINIDEIKSFYEGVKNGLFIPDPDDLTTKSKDLNWEALDINDNGVPDGYRSEDGDIIIVMVDENEDEVLDVMLMNFNGDDKWDAEVYDKDKDGFPEYWLIDKNGNGKLDNHAIDTDKDGYPDYFL